jgi:hypothetical protein
MLGASSGARTTRSAPRTLVNRASTGSGSPGARGGGGSSVSRTSSTNGEGASAEPSSAAIRQER